MKRILVSLLFVIGVASCPVHAEIITHRWDGNTYVGEVKGGQLHGQGKYIGADGIKYEGQWKYSKFHGQGTLIMPDGNKFVGEFRDNNAWEVVVYRSGAITGTFVQGQWCKGCQPKKATGSSNSLSGLLGALGAATKQAQKSNQSGGASASSLLGALQKATKQAQQNNQAGSTSGTQQTASLSSMMSGGSAGNLMEEFRDVMFERFPRGAATSYVDGKKALKAGITGPIFPANHPTVIYLQKVVTALTMQSHRAITYSGTYRIVVVDDPDYENMVASPGGFVLVTRKYLDLLENEDQLAFWLAHELSHVELEHGYSMAVNKISMEIFSGLHGSSSSVMDSVDKMYNDAAKNRYNADIETEADLRALEIVTKAGYDPSQALRSIKKIGDLFGDIEGYKDAKERLSLARKHVKDKNLSRRGSKEAFEFRTKRFQKNLGRNIQTASSSTDSGSKKKKSKSSVEDDK